ncbi:MAG: DNA alkylation repair protein [Actinomycetota bacterium]|nr:DNA alkylation repair protein [Actinomycetota bacterium]
MNHAAEADVLLAQLAALGTPQRAEGERAYLKSSLQFVGTGVPAVRRTVKAWLRAHRTPTHDALTHDALFGLARALWAHPVHECRLAAIELLMACPQLVTTADLPWVEATLRDCHTWALVDPLAGWVVAELAVREPTTPTVLATPTVPAVLDQWVADPDFWLRRSAVLALRALLRDDRELDRFFAYADALLPEQEFFIRKVLGWVLREVATRHPERVSRWLRERMTQMNLVTLREPLRKLADAAELRALYDASRPGNLRKRSG